MSKIVVQNYAFDASARTVTFSDYASIALENVLLITNLTKGAIIFNFADSAKGGTVASNVLTLEHDTTAHDDTDDLAIHYWDSTRAPSAAGQATMANSKPVVLASNQTAIPVTQSGTWDEIGINDSGNSITVDDGASSLTVDGTVTIQDGGGSITVDGTVSVTGVATLAEQQTQTAHLATIAGDTTDIEAAVELLDNTVATMGGTTYTIAQTQGLIIAGVRTDADTSIVNTTNEIAPFQVDALGRLKVEAFSGETLPVSLASVPSHAVTNAGTFAVQSTNQTGDNTIGRVKLTDGTDVADILDLANSNPLTVAIVDTSGDQISSFGGGTQYTEDAAAAANPVGTAPILVRKDTPASEVSADGDNVAQRGTTYGAAYVTLLDTGGSPVSVGGGTQYTEDAAAAANPIGNALVLVREDARAGGLTSADGDNVAARGNNKGELYTIDTDANAKLTTITGHVDGIEGLLTTIDGDTSTLAGAVAGTEMQVDIVTSALPSGAATSAKQDTEITSLQLIDDIVYVDDADWTDDTSKHALVGGVYQSAPHTVTDGDVTPFLTDVNGRLVVAATDNGGTLSIDDGGGAITVDGTVAVTNAGLTALNGAISGSEVQVDVVGALPAGTNAIGKLAANSGVDIGDVDVTSLPALATGTNYIGKISPPDVDVTTHTNYAKKYYTNAGAVTDGIVWSPAAGKRWHVVSMFINVSAAATVTLEDDLAAGDSAVMKMELAANSGTVINFGEKYPLASGEDAADLLVTTSAGNIYITITGYEI